MDLLGSDLAVHRQGLEDVKPWFVYLLRCSDNSLYCGVTNDIEKRVSKHSTGKGAKYTRSRLPVDLVWQSSGTDRSTALKAEYYIKKHTKREKELLATGTGILNQALAKIFGLNSWKVTIDDHCRNSRDCRTNDDADKDAEVLF